MTRDKVLYALAAIAAGRLQFGQACPRSFFCSSPAPSE